MLGDGGVCYLLLERENDVEEVVDLISQMDHLTSTIIMERRAKNEM